MAWVAGSDVSTGDLITAAQWNNYMGATGSLEYLKGVADLAILEDGTNTFTADQPMGGFSLTGLAAGAAAGESVRYDELYAATQNDVTGARAIDSTIYQNGAKIRIATITAVFNATGANELMGVYCENVTPPTVLIATISNEGLNANLRLGITFVIPPLYYYKAVPTSTPVLSTWIEWDLH